MIPRGFPYHEIPPGYRMPIAVVALAIAGVILLGLWAFA